MKNHLLILAFSLSSTMITLAQEASPASDKQWNFGADANLYFLPDEFIMVPIFVADKNHLHLEARYNYEDIETLSVWAGYNLSGGNNFEYLITPMAGGVVGLSNGLAAGVELTFNFKRFELYSESEYLFEFESTENNFYYHWADLTYSITEWLWTGISGQRTRLYKTERDIQHGFILGGGYKALELTGYLYNPEAPFLLFTLSVSF